MIIHYEQFVISDWNWNYLLITPLKKWVGETFFIDKYNYLRDKYKDDKEKDYRSFYDELEYITDTRIEWLGNKRFIDLNVC